MTDRAACCVPFCRRTTRNDVGQHFEWVCGTHWRVIPREVRKAKYDAYRAYRRRFGTNPYWAYPAGSPDRIACVDADHRCRDAWSAAKNAAIERAAGIL